VILTKEIVSIYGLVILVLAKSLNTYKDLPETVSKEICDNLRSPKEGVVQNVLVF
jgi:hypothetical protein